MFYINKDTELTKELLSKMINKFNIEVEPRLYKYKNYYDGIQKILNKRYRDTSKPYPEISRKALTAQLLTTVKISLTLIVDI